MTVFASLSEHARRYTPLNSLPPQAANLAAVTGETDTPLSPTASARSRTDSATSVVFDQYELRERSETQEALHGAPRPRAHGRTCLPSISPPKFAKQVADILLLSLRRRAVTEGLRPDLCGVHPNFAEPLVCALSLSALLTVGNTATYIGGLQAFIASGNVTCQSTSIPLGALACQLFSSLGGLVGIASTTRKTRDPNRLDRARKIAIWSVLSAHAVGNCVTAFRLVDDVPAGKKPLETCNGPITLSLFFPFNLAGLALFGTLAGACCGAAILTFRFCYLPSEELDP